MQGLGAYRLYPVQRACPLPAPVLSCGYPSFDSSPLTPPCPPPPPRTGGSGASLLGSGPVLPALGAAGLEKYLALVLLVACLMRVVAVRPLAAH